MITSRETLNYLYKLSRKLHDDAEDYWSAGLENEGDLCYNKSVAIENAIDVISDLITESPNC